MRHTYRYHPKVDLGRALSLCQYNNSFAGGTCFAKVVLTCNIVVGRAVSGLAPMLCAGCCCYPRHRQVRQYDGRRDEGLQERDRGPCRQCQRSGLLQVFGWVAQLDSVVPTGQCMSRHPCVAEPEHPQCKPKCIPLNFSRAGQRNALAAHCPPRPAVQRNIEQTRRGTLAWQS